MLLKSMSLRAFFILIVSVISIIFSIAIFLKVNYNYQENSKIKFKDEVNYLARVSRDAVKKSEQQLMNEAKIIANFESVYYAFKEKKYLIDNWESNGNIINIKTKEATGLEYTKLMSNVLNTVYQSGIGHVQGEKMMQFFDMNLSPVAVSYDFPEKFQNIGKEEYLESAIGGRDIRLSVDASEISVIEERENELMIKGIAPIGKYIRFNSNNVYGLVVVGEFINRAYLEEIKKIINKDIIIIKGNMIIESTIENNKGSTKGEKVKFRPAGDSFFYDELYIKGNKGGFSFFPLTDFKGNTIAYVGVGSYIDKSDETYIKNVADFIMFELAAFIILAITFYFIIRGQYITFEKITAKVMEIQKGNYRNKIEIEARKELKIMIDGINNLSEVVYKRENELKEMNIRLEVMVNERTEELQQMIHKMKGVEKLASIIYTEKDERKTIEYILEALTSEKVMNYKKAMFMIYDKHSENLIPKGYSCNGDDDSIYTYSNDEIIYFAVNRDKNIVTEAFNEKKIKEYSGDQELIVSEKIVFNNYFVLPIFYEENSFGVLIVEKVYDKLEDEIEIIKIFMNNLAVYFENIRLQEEELQTNELKTLVKLSSGIVHELRTPITTIRGLSSILLSKYPNDDKIKRYVKVIISETKRIDGMAADVLEYAEGRKPQSEGIKININSLIGEAVADMEQDLRSNSFEVRFETFEEVVEYIGERGKLRQVFSNIIKNAIEAGKGYEDSITIKVNKYGRDIKVEFIDKGVGINKEIMPKIFEPLVTSKIQGTGLGLTIVKDVLERHNNSHVRVYGNEDGRGTTVEIILK